jgi:conjugal transfer pilin signal peptidase TrbI
MYPAVKQNKTSRRQFTRFIGGVLVGTAGGLAVQGTLANYVQIGLDKEEYRCFPWRVYIMSEGRPEVVKAGMLVRFNPGTLMTVPGKGPANAGRDVIKMVAATANDRVEIRRDRILINSVPLGQIVMGFIGVELETPGIYEEVTVKLGSTPEQYEREFVVPEGAVFMIGSSVNSFDSRYWGVLPVQAINGRAFPVA